MSCKENNEMEIDSDETIKKAVETCFEDNKEYTGSDILDQAGYDYELLDIVLFRIVKEGIFKYGTDFFTKCDHSALKYIVNKYN